MGKLIDLTGQTFGRLTVLHLSPNRAPTTIHGEAKSAPLWRCICVCNREKDVRSDCLRQGITRSCGCMKADSARAAHKTRRRQRHPLLDRVLRYRAMGLTWNEVGKLMDMDPNRAFNIVRREKIREAHYDQQRQILSAVDDDNGTPPATDHGLPAADQRGGDHGRVEVD